MLALGHADEGQIFSMEHQGRHSYRRQDRANIGGVGLSNIGSCFAAKAHPALTLRKPSAEGFIVSQVRMAELGHHLGSPVLLEKADHSLGVGQRVIAPRIVGGLYESGCRVEQDESSCALRLGGSKECSSWTCLIYPEYCRTFRSNGVENGKGIVRPILPSRQRLQRHRVRGSDTATVKHDQSTEGGKAPQEAG